nr:helix-turn-helix domain-containing protein [Rhodococcus sp. 06-621-2]
MVAAPDPDRAYEALFEIGAQIQAREYNLDAVLTLIVEKVAELLGTDLAWLALVEEGSTTLRTQASTGAHSPEFKKMTVEVGAGIGGVALEQQKSIIVSDYVTFIQDTPTNVRLAVEVEGLASLICAPMLRDARMIGALYVGNRVPTVFGSREATLVTALARQASIAIENSRLLRQLDLKNRMLEETQVIHRQLTDASLHRIGVDGLGKLLAELLGRSLTIVQETVPPFRRTFLRGEEESLHDTAAEAAIAAGADQLGWVLVHGADELSELQQRALEHGVTVLALELMKEQTTFEVEWRLGGELLEQILDRSSPVDQRLTARAARFGLDLARPHRIVALESHESDFDVHEVRRAAASAFLPHRTPPLLTKVSAGRVVLVLPEPLEERVDDVVRAVASAVGSCSLGVSRRTTDPRRGVREAVACARFGALSGGRRPVIRADDLGAMRFLFALDDPTPLHDYVEEQLGALRSHEEAHGGALFETLRAFLEADGHHPSIAEACLIHKSTVKYRIGRLNEVLNRPLSEPEVRFELRLAVALADVLKALGLEPEAAG